MSDLTLFRNALKDLMRAKKLGAALLLAALPTVIAAIWRASARDFPPDVAYNTLEAGLVFGFTLVILSVVFGTGVLAQEIEQKTIVYLLTRPIPRWRLLLIKFLAAVITTTVTVWVASVLLAFVIYGPKGLDPGASRLGRDLLILPVGALAYTALFLLLATLLNRPLTYGLLFAFGWESWVPNMPGNFQKLSLMAYLRILAPHPQPEAETVDLSQLLSAFNPQTITNRLAWEVMAGVIVVALLAALLIFSTNEYVPREDAE
jgi:ABC-2 type transport system permease protein